MLGHWMLAQFGVNVYARKESRNAARDFLPTPNVKHCTGAQRLQYFTSSPFDITSSVYLLIASLNEYWKITLIVVGGETKLDANHAPLANLTYLFTTYATGKHRKGVMNRESHNTLLATVSGSVPCPKISGKTSLKITSWAIP